MLWNLLCFFPPLLPGNRDKAIIQPKLAETQTEYKTEQKILGNNITLHDLVDFLISNKEVDLYYYLLNEVFVVSFSSEMIEISPIRNNKEYNARLGDIISTLRGQKISIVISDKNDGVSLKTALIRDLEQSKSWKELHLLFPGCEILDIIHKNG